MDPVFSRLGGFFLFFNDVRLMIVYPIDATCAYVFFFIVFLRRTNRLEQMFEYLLISNT